MQKRDIIMYALIGSMVLLIVVGIATVVTLSKTQDRDIIKEALCAISPEKPEIVTYTVEDTWTLPTQPAATTENTVT